MATTRMNTTTKNTTKMNTTKVESSKMASSKMIPSINQSLTFSGYKMKSQKEEESSKSKSESAISRSIRNIGSLFGKKGKEKPFVARTKLKELMHFHFFIPTEEVNDLLPEKGDFLLRENVLADKKAVVILNVRSESDAVKHLPVEFDADDNMFCIIDGIGRPNIVELINYHWLEKIPVRDCFLVNPIRRNIWEFVDDGIVFEDKILGEGNFAVVKPARLNVGDKWINVACKILKLKSSMSKAAIDNAKFQILREFKVGETIRNHPFIMTIHGLYVASEQLAVIMEFCDGGVLEKYVQTNTTDEIQKLDFLFQAADGLNYMHEKDLIHRDIAGRNFLLMKGGKRYHNNPMVKVSDFGLTRQGPVYKMIKDHAVPYLISALECLDEENPVWTTKSDCWSFGVFTWHMFENCKKEPYADLLVMNSNALNDLLKTGTRLKPPAAMPNEVKELMTECFNADPNKRPDMYEIQDRLYCCMSRILLDKTK